jgi:osmotically inducible protein OsmC
MALRKAEAVWEGTLTEGNGTFSVQSGRFEDEPGTNPEELIGAAHASCFSMAFSGQLTRANFPPTRIHTTADVTFEKGESGWTITNITLHTEAEVPGIDEATFQEKAKAAKETCPISRALASVDITLDAKLV